MVDHFHLHIFCHRLNFKFLFRFFEKTLFRKNVVFYKNSFSDALFNRRRNERKTGRNGAQKRRANDKNGKIRLSNEKMTRFLVSLNTKKESALNFDNEY